MRRRKRRRSNTIYNHARGDGWILTTCGNRDIESGRIDVVLYYTDEQRIETHETRNSKHSPGVHNLLSQYLDVGAKLGAYEGTKPEPHVDYSDQPRAVRMQRHATDLYAELGHARGMSETIAVKAAETFGSRWSEKTDWQEWQERVSGVGKGRGGTFAAELL